MKKILVPTGFSNNATKAIGAWGASRVMNYFEKDNGINAKKIAIIEQSRSGKASLWTAAEDQRFAIRASNCSGSIISVNIIFYFRLLILYAAMPGAYGSLLKPCKHFFFGTKLFSN